MEKIYSEVYVHQKRNDKLSSGDPFIIVDAWKPHTSYEEKGLPAIIKLSEGHLNADFNYVHEGEEYTTMPYGNNDATIVRKAIALFDHKKDQMYE